PDLTVEQNIVLGREPRRGPFVDRSAMRALATTALARIASSLEPTARIGSLGPSERQLVEIARALAFDASVVILDEPTSSLTAIEVQRLFAVLRALRDEGRAIVYVSHFLEEVLAVADRYSVLRDGRCVASGDMSTTSASELTSFMAGRRLDEVYPPPRVGRSDDTGAGSVPALEARELVGRPLPDAANLTLSRGEIFGVFGLVGAGRTELLRVLFGLDKARVRDVMIAGRRLHGGPPEALRAGLGLASEDRKDEGTALDLSIALNITLSRLAACARHGVVSKRRQRSAAQACAEAFHVRCPGMQVAVSTLSGGNQQKVALARLLHDGVDVLLLDEPTRGIDVASKAEIYARLHELAGRGKSILFVSSYVPELLGVCDRIAVVHRGTLVETRAVAAWTEHDLIGVAAQGPIKHEKRA
nr:sugar ABC transporter ATP-binding protein [Planctomycetota bacterium]